MSPIHRSTLRRHLVSMVVVTGSLLLAANVLAQTSPAAQNPSAASPTADPIDATTAPPLPEEPPFAPASPTRTVPPPVIYAPAPEPEARVLLGSHVSHGGYGGPDAKITSLAGSTALLVGAQGGWIVDHTFVLGIGGYGLASDAASPDELQTAGSQRSTLSLSYGGGRLAFVPASKRALHLVVGVLAGGGRVSSASPGGERVGDGFFVIEPDVGFEGNIAQPVRIVMGASYRLTGGTQLSGLGPTALNGPSAFLALKFGAF